MQPRRPRTVRPGARARREVLERLSSSKRNEGFLRAHFFRRKVLADKRVTTRISRLIGETLRNHQEHRTAAYELGGKLYFRGISALGPDGGLLESHEEKGPHKSFHSATVAPERFAFDIHAHPERYPKEEEMHLLSEGDTKRVKNYISSIAIVPVYEAPGKRIPVTFYFVRFPRNFEGERYENLLFQEIEGNESNLTLEIQNRLLRQLGAKISSVRMLVDKRKPVVSFSSRTREKIIRELL